MFFGSLTGRLTPGQHDRLADNDAGSWADPGAHTVQQAPGLKLQVHSGTKVAQRRPECQLSCKYTAGGCEAGGRPFHAGCATPRQVCIPLEHRRLQHHEGLTPSATNFATMQHASAADLSPVPASPVSLYTGCGICYLPHMHG